MSNSEFHGSESEQRANPLNETTARLRVNPEMLILAREYRGLTQSELAQRLNVSQGKISKLEDGLLVVSEPDLLRIADILNLPRRFFFREDVKRSVFNAFYRKRASLPQKFLTQFNARVCFIQAQVERLMRKTEMDRVSFPEFDPEECPAEPAQIAQQVRQILRIPPGPIKDVIRRFEDAGIVVLYINFGTLKLDGVSTLTNSGTPIIFVNSAFPPSRCTATAVHEFAHIIMHRIPSPDTEQQAWEFTAEFLMPAADIRKELQPVTIDRLARLKLRWRVSMAYLLRRAHSLSLISDQVYKGLCIHLARLGYKTNEPHEEFLASDRPALQKELLTTHLDELGYTRAELCELLDIGEIELDEMLETKPTVQLRIVK